MSETPGAAYRVDVDAVGCEFCGEGNTYTVVGPDGYACGQSWACKDDAQEYADELNAVYAAGLAEGLRQAQEAKAPADVFIQWKGTDVCLDFHCYKCNTFAHFDGDFAYSLRCPTCGTVYDLPDILPLRDSTVPPGEREGCIQEPTEPEQRLAECGWTPTGATTVKFPDFSGAPGGGQPIGGK